MIYGKPPLVLQGLVSDIVRLLPEYVPGMETGAAANTEGRSCWIKTWRAILTVLGHEHGMEVIVQEDGDSALQRQLTMLWKRGEGIQLAVYSGWGDRQELERRFQKLETLKAPQKIILYSCLKWQEAVIEQLCAALLRYPHHIEGEQYLTLNMMGPSHLLEAHLFTVPHSGLLQLSDIHSLATLPGSPFLWRGTREQTVAT